MKCIRCQYDSKYPERTNRLCPRCQREFAFEPRTGDPITDAGMKSAIDAVSSLGTVRFLADHVYYEIARRKKSKGAKPGLYFLSAASLLLAITAPVAGLVLCATFGGLGVLVPKPALASMSRSTFDPLWQRWLKVHGAPLGLIVRKEQAPYRTHDDIQNYSFDRAVICDHGGTVDVLLANNFHFENNCAVLSVGGYPANAFAPVRAMLKNNPRLVVYVLHDATSEGCLLAHKLASEKQWFLGSARVVEVGIRPANVQKLRGVWGQAVKPVRETPLLTKAEHSWLDRYVLELAAIRPEQVIKRLYAAIASEATLEPASKYLDVGDYGEFWVDSRSFSAEAEASDGGDDSFG